MSKKERGKPVKHPWRAWNPGMLSAKTGPIPEYQAFPKGLLRTNRAR